MVSVARKYRYIPGGCCDLCAVQAPGMSLAVIMVRRKKTPRFKVAASTVLVNFLRGLTSTEYSAENAA